jgi:hypothetical protein
MNSFYGYKVVGIYQTPEEWLPTPRRANGLEPGDFKYEDVNKGQRHRRQRPTVLGAYIPNFTYGLNFALSGRKTSTSC